MHYFYILHSNSIDKYYIGETPNIDVRVKQYNCHYFKKSYTKAASDWRIALALKCASKEEALYLEKFVKRMKSRKFTGKVIANPKILLDILEKR